MSSKICNNFSNEGFKSLLLKKTDAFRQRKNLEVRQKNFLLNDYVVKSNAEVIILITNVKIFVKVQTCVVPSFE